VFWRLEKLFARSSDVLVWPGGTFADETSLFFPARGAAADSDAAAAGKNERLRSTWPPQLRTSRTSLRKCARWLIKRTPAKPAAREAAAEEALYERHAAAPSAAWRRKRRHLPSITISHITPREEKFLPRRRSFLLQGRERRHDVNNALRRSAVDHR